MYKNHGDYIRVDADLGLTNPKSIQVFYEDKWQDVGGFDCSDELFRFFTKKWLEINE